MNRVEKLLDFLKDNPADSFVKHALALEYVKVGNDGEARGLFESILDTDPGYTGTYYHLAKLLERQGLPLEAAAVYKRGMQECQKQGERHALNELRSALEDLEN